MRSLEAALKSCQKELKDEKAKLDELKEHFKYNLKLINDRDVELQQYDALFLGNLLSLSSCLLLQNYIITRQVFLLLDLLHIVQGARLVMLAGVCRRCL